MEAPSVCFSALDLSSKHISPQTREMMREERLTGALIYNKGPWGWFVNIPSKDEGPVIGEEVPDDLKACMEYAQAGNHQWMILDCDGTVSELLPTYDDVDVTIVHVKFNPQVNAHQAGSQGDALIDEARGHYPTPKTIDTFTSAALAA